VSMAKYGTHHQTSSGMEVVMKGMVGKIAICGAVAAMALAPVLARQGEGPRRGPGRGPGPGMVDRMADALGLSADQRTQVRKIAAKSIGGSLGDHMDAMRQAGGHLDAVFHDPTADGNQVRDAAQSVAAQELLIAMDRHAMATEIDSVLTDDQRAKAA